MCLRTTETRVSTEEILSAVEVAKELRCSKAHVYNVMHGRVEGVLPLPSIPMGRRRLVRRSALEAWKRASEQNAITFSEGEAAIQVRRQQP
jgi:excisionase family DNA binding protein